MPTEDKMVGFTEKGARRVARATQIVEQAYRLPAIGARRVPLTVPMGVQLAVTGPGGISEGTLEMPGTGEVELYGFDGENPSESLGITAPAWNIGGAIDGNKPVLVCGGAPGWWVVVELCD